MKSLSAIWLVVIAAQQLKLPEIKVENIKTGGHYSVDKSYGKVMLVTDKGAMIIEIGDSKKEWKEKRTIVVLCEFPDRNVRIGQADQLDRLLGSSYVTVAAPRQYHYRSKGKTVPSPKVFVLRPYSGRN